MKTFKNIPELCTTKCKAVWQKPILPVPRPPEIFISHLLSLKRPTKPPFPRKPRVKTARHFLEPKAHGTHKALNKEPVRLLCWIPGPAPCCSLPKQDGGNVRRLENTWFTSPMPHEGDEIFRKRNERSFICCTISKAGMGSENEYKLNRHNSQHLKAVK